MTTLSAALAARDRTREAEQWNEDTESLALDWIAKALPLMKLDLERRRFTDYDDGENRAYGDRDIAMLTALIAQAEGVK